MSEEKITTFEQLLEFIRERKTSNTQSNYQPLVIKTLIENNGSSTVDRINDVTINHNKKLENTKMIVSNSYINQVSITIHKYYLTNSI
jgi:hypothetical protein